MANFLSLLKVQFISLLSTNKLLKKFGKKNATLILTGFGVLAFALIFGLGYFYSWTILMVSNPVEYLPSMLSLAVFVCLIFSFATTGLSLYAYKDYELLSSMPIKTHHVVLSKLVVTYLLDLIFTIIILASATLCFFVEGGIAIFDAGLISGSVFLYLLKLFAMAIFSPAFSMVVSIVVGFVLSLISSRFNKRALVQTILMLILAAGIVSVSFLNPEAMMGQTALFNKVFFLSKMVVKGTTDILYALLFIGIMVLSFAVVVTVICLTYKRMHALLKAYKKSSGFKLEGYYAPQGQFKVLVKKEIKTLLSIPMYAANTLMGSVMAIVLVIAIMFLPNTEIGKTMFEQAPELQQMMSQSMPALINVIVAFSLSISPISAVSIAVEGKYFYLMKTWPISTKQFVKAKLSLNYIFAVIPAVIIAIVSIFIADGVSWIIILESALCIVLYPLVSGNIGMLANLFIPNLKWENINQAVKQSPSLLISVFYGMGVSALVGLALFSLKWELELIFLLILSVLVVLFITTQILIYKYCDKLIRTRT